MSDVPIYLGDEEGGDPHAAAPTCGWDRIAAALYEEAPANTSLRLARDDVYDRVLIIAEIDGTQYVLGEADDPAREEA